MFILYLFKILSPTYHEHMDGGKSVMMLKCVVKLGFIPYSIQFVFMEVSFLSCKIYSLF